MSFEVINWDHDEKVIFLGNLPVIPTRFQPSAYPTPAIYVPRRNYTFPIVKMNLLHYFFHFCLGFLKHQLSNKIFVTVFPIRHSLLLSQCFQKVSKCTFATKKLRRKKATEQIHTCSPNSKIYTAFTVFTLIMYYKIHKNIFVPGMTQRKH